MHAYTYNQTNKMKKQNKCVFLIIKQSKKKCVCEDVSTHIHARDRTIQKKQNKRTRREEGHKKERFASVKHVYKTHADDVGVKCAYTNREKQRVKKREAKERINTSQW